MSTRAWVDVHQAFLDRAQQSQQAYAPDPSSPEAAAIRDAMVRPAG